MQPGQIVAGRYRLDEVIGRGGMGTVWRATDQQLDTVVALKRAHHDDIDNDNTDAADSAAGRKALRRLRREARIAAELTHPHVVSVLDVVPDDWQWWLVMEYVPSRSLAEVIKEQGTLEPRRAARLGAQLADALATVHAKGVQHRDVKPGNVLVATDGGAKLADFGISRTMHGDETPTSTGLIPGTPGYLAPEVADGHEPRTASDVFSLGATLFAAVEGTTPVGAPTPPMAAVRRAVEGKFLAPRRAGPLAPVLGALLRLHPADRPDAACAARLLGDVAEGRVPVIPTGRRRRIRRGLLVPAAALVGALSITAGLLVFQSDTAAATVGDPRTADPCALIDTAPLAELDPELDASYGSFDRCDVVLREGGHRMVDVEVRFGGPDAAQAVVSARPKLEQIGRVRVERRRIDAAGECARNVLLPDGYLVWVIAKPVDSDVAPVLNGRPAEMCPIADVATSTVATVLNRGGEIRRRAPFPAGSLGTRDACLLLDDAALSTAVPGMNTTDAHPGFGNWECRWFNNPAPQKIHVIFERDVEPLRAGDDGTLYQIGTHTAAWEPNGYGSHGCTADVTNGMYQDATGRRKVELLTVDVNAAGFTPDQMCGPARALAEAATAKLR